MNFAHPRRLRFSLRIALIAVALLSLIFGLVGRRWQHARRQAAGRAAVTQMGGEYRWDWDEATGSAVDERNQWIAVTSTEPPDRPTLAERVFGADFAHDIVAAYFSTSPSGLSAHLPTDGDVERIVRLLPQLKALDLSFTPVTDEALQRLAELPRLEWLNLYATRVSDAGLPWLNRLPKLKVLIVAETEMSVPGLARAAPRHPSKKSGSRAQRSAHRRESTNLSPGCRRSRLPRPFKGQPGDTTAARWRGRECPRPPNDSGKVKSR